MDHNEFIERAEAEGMTIQAEEIEQEQWVLRAIGEDGTAAGTLPVSKQVVQDLYASGRLTRVWEAE